MRSAAGGALFALAALGACAEAGTGPTAAAPAPAPAPLYAAAAGGITGEYVVVLKAEANPVSVAAVAGAKPRHVYTAAVNGFAASLNAGQLTALRHHPAVEYVEEDQVAEVAQTSATWGLDRINQRNLPLDGNAGFGSPTGSNVTAYIVDTGVRTTHAQFGARATNVFSAVGSMAVCHGHGTHVAGIVGGTTYGVAKSVRIRGVIVFNCQGAGSISGVIAGMDWVRANAQRPAVATLSLSTAYSPTMNAAANSLASSGVFVAAASGNSNANACNYSPASATAVTTVNASTSTDARASFSNYGSCTHLYAPGQHITSAWHTSNTATNTISGTSQAAAFVAGVGAQYLSGNTSASSMTVRAWIINLATANVISGNPAGTPNRLLYR